MDTKLLITFILLNIVNVIVQTVKSLATVKCGKGSAALVNAVAYGFYTIVTIYMLCDLPLFWKAGIVAGCNLIGVFVVKWAEEKARKDRLWKVEATVSKEEFELVKSFGEVGAIPFNYIDINKYVLVNFYCATQQESKIVKELLNRCHAKYFVSESKTL